MMMASAPRPSSSSLRGKRSRLLSSLSTAVCISYRLPLLFLLGPLLCLIASVANVYPEDPRAGRMLGIVLWVASWWCTEVLPLPATALLPFILQPTLGIISSDRAASAYLNDSAFLFLGSFFLAQAVERWKLHRRLALMVLGTVGTRPARLMLGFVGVAAFLSMWISNTGTSVLMVPMAVGVLETLRSAQTESDGNGVLEQKGDEELLKRENDDEEAEEDDDDDDDGVVVLRESEDDTSEAEMGLLTGVSRSQAEEMEHDEVGAMSMELSPSAAEVIEKEAQGGGRGGVTQRRKGASGGRHRRNDVVGPNAKKVMSPIDKYSIGLVLAIAYACSIGGLATLTGTGPNIVLSGYWSRCHADQELNFSNWLLLGVPLAFSLTFLLWAVMAFLYARDMSSQKVNLNTQSLEDEMRALEPPSWPEKVIIVDFVMTVLLWLTRRTEIGGWSDLFPPATAPKDGTVSALSAIVLFMVPTYDGKGGRVLDWNTAKGLPWDIVLILGAGFSMSAGIQASGLLLWLGENLAFFATVPLWLVPLGIATVVTTITEFTSNVATSTIVMPLLDGIAAQAKIPFQLVLLPATLACSLAFMLPNATPPNAVAYASGYLTVPQMMRPGFLLNVIGVFLISIFCVTLAPAVLGYSLERVANNSSCL